MIHQRGLVRHRRRVVHCRFPEHAVAINRPNAALLATLMSAEAEELGTLRLSRTQRADFLSDMLHYFGYHLDAINKVQSLRILGEIF